MGPAIIPCRLQSRSAKQSNYILTIIIETLFERLLFALIKPKAVQHPYCWELWIKIMILKAFDWYNSVWKFCFSNQQLTEKDFFINYHVRSDIKPFKPRCCHPNGLQITWIWHIKHDTYLTLLWMEKTKSFLNLTKTLSDWFH